VSKHTELREGAATSLRFDSVKPGLAVPSVFWTTDARLRVTSVDGSGLEALGITAEELLGQPLTDHLQGASAEDTILVAHRRVLAGESLQFEAKLTGTPVEVSMEPQRSTEGAVIGVIGMARFARPIPAEFLPQVEHSHRFQALVDKSTDVVALSDESCIVHFVSQSIERILGIPAAEWLGKSGFGIVHKDDERAAREMYADVLSKPGRSRTGEFRVLANDKSWRQLEVTCTNFLQDPDVHAVVTNFRDMTERKRVEAERQVMGEIIHALNVTSNLDELLTRMHGALKRVVSAKNCFVALYEQTTGMFHFPFVVDRHDIAPPPQKAGRTCSAYVFRTGKPLIATRKVFDDLVARGEIEIVGTPSAAWLGVPLRTPSGTLGVLVVQNYEDENAYGERDLELMVSVGAQIALAIERKRAEQELRKREQEHTIILNSVPGMIVYKDRDSRIVRANQVAAEFLGVPIEEMKGLLVTDLWPDIGGVSEKEDREVMETGEPRMSVIKVLRAASGEEKIVRTHRVAYRDLDGQIAGVIVFATDITDQSRSREMLEKVRLQNELILQCAGEGIYGVDRDGKCSLVNPAAAALTGWSREELLGNELHEVIHHSRNDGKPYPAEECPVTAMFRDGVSRRVSDEVFWRKDGTSFPVEYLTTPIREGDKVVGAVVTFRDISHEHQAQRVLRESEARYRLLVENAAYGIFRTDPNGRILDANDPLASILGYDSVEELRHINIRQDVYAHPEQRDPLIAETISRGRLDGREVEWKRKDGSTVIVRLSARLVRDPSGGFGFEGIAENVTEWRALETQFRQAQKMEAVGRLAGGVAHDFNNLLMVIKGHTELLLERTGPEHPDYRKVDQIKKAADRAAGLTRQLLAFSRMQVLQPRVMDLNTTVTEMGRMLPRLIGEDIDLAILTKPDLGRVKGDPGQLEQVILNLAVNARDAMPEGGKLLIETCNVVLDEDYARLHPPLTPGKFVMLAVSDTGTGMDASTQAHIFEPFFTTKEKGKGTGLGLATVYGVVKQSGGFIWVYSEQGKGTTFKIYLPRVDEVLDMDREKKHRRDELPRGTGTILLAEDEKDVREVAREFLELSGYAVIEAKDGAEAIEKAEKYSGAIALLVTDMVMPGMSGRELASKLTAMRPEMKVVFMSGYTEYAALRHGDFELNNTLLQKPFTRTVLSHAVHKALSGNAE
jgi:two-component system cell cycle sensor histidine kinase/response regulator CckA